MRVTIDCPHCGKATRVDLAAEMSTQRCDKCEMRFSAVSTGLIHKKRKRVMMDHFAGRPVHQEWDEHGRAVARPPVSARVAWMLAGAAFLAVSLVVGFFAWKGRGPEGGTSVARPMGAGILAGELESGPVSAYQSLKSRFVAGIEAAKVVLNAPTVDDLLPLVRNGDRLEARMRTYYADAGRGTLPVGYNQIAPMDRHTWVDKYKLIVISYLNKERRLRAVAFEENADGSFLADWPSMIGLCEVPLKDFVRKQETQPRLFRVLGGFDDYYNGAFEDEREFICLKMNDTSGEALIYGYARRSSDAGKQLAAVRLPIGRRGILPITVSLRFPENPQTPDQVEITAFHTSGWVLPADKEPGASPGPASASARPPNAN